MLQSMSSLIPLLWVLLAGLLSYGVAFVLCEALLRRRWRRNVIEPLSAMLTELRELHEATPGALQAAKLRNASEAETARQAEKPRPCIGEGTAKRLVSWAEFDPNGLTAPPAQQAV